MDAIITPQELVDTAIRWGHKAIAVTDHGNVQAYPEVMLALEKAQKSGKDNGLKILYGMEAYYVNDTARCVFGSKYPSFDDEMVVFDIETTGLSNRNCKIIEIGAVKIKQGEILDTLDFFVDPEEPIPPEITELTSITDDMVKGQIKEREAIEKFLAFAGDSLLIAHNAKPAFFSGRVRKVHSLSKSLGFLVLLASPHPSNAQAAHYFVNLRFSRVVAIRKCSWKSRFYKPTHKRKRVYAVSIQHFLRSP